MKVLSVVCPICNKQRMVKACDTNYRSPRCRSCAAKEGNKTHERATYVMDGEPTIGQIVNGRVIGRRRKDRFQYCACQKCGKPRWVRIEHGKPRSQLCKGCLEISTVRVGYGRVTWNGYQMVILDKDSFFLPMARRSGNRCTRHVLEHRLVMAQSLGRCLHQWEVVHHVNGIKNDNRIENLQLVSDLGHKQLTALETKIDKQTQLIEDLRKEIRLLRLTTRQGVLS